MSDLPKGWAWARLGEIAATSLGKMLDKKQATGLDPTPYLRNVNVRWGTFHLGDLASMDIRPEELDRVLAQSGDVIACEGGEPGRSAVWRGAQTIALQKALHRIRPTGAILPEYLAHLLHHLALSRRLEVLFTGTTIKHLPQEKLRVVPVPLPPINEQERIVAAIEEHLSRLDAADASLVHAQRRRDGLARRIIDVALEGPERSLRDLVREPLRNGMSARASDDGSVRVVTLTAVTRNEFTDEHTKLIDTLSRKVDDLWMQPGDIFIQRSNTPELVGTAAMYRGEPEWAIFPDLLIRVRAGDRVVPEYLALALQCGRTRSYFQRSAQGIAGSMPKISQPIVEAAQIPLPSVVRQREIADRVSEQIGVVSRLGSDLALARKRQASLRRSILAAAFSGKLVPQDPDDEPASVLLERIRAERAAAPAPKRRSERASSA